MNLTAQKLCFSLYLNLLWSTEVSIGNVVRLRLMLWGPSYWGQPKESSGSLQDLSSTQQFSLSKSGDNLLDWYIVVRCMEVSCICTCTTHVQYTDTEIISLHIICRVAYMPHKWNSPSGWLPWSVDSQEVDKLTSAKSRRVGWNVQIHSCQSSRTQSFTCMHVCMLICMQTLLECLTF